MVLIFCIHLSLKYLIPLHRENSQHDSSSMIGQLVAKEKKCSLEPSVVPPTEDCVVKMKFDSKEPNPKTQNVKPNQSESLTTNRDGLSSMNGSIEAAGSPEGGAGSSRIGSNRLNIVKNQALDNKSVQDGQDRNVLSSKESKSKDAGTHNNGGSGGSLEVISSCKVANSKQPPTMDDDGINKSSGSDEYTSISQGNKTIKTECGTIKNINDLANNGSCCAISQPENVPDVSQVEPDSLFATKDQATMDKSYQSGGQTKETGISKKSNTKDATTRNEKSGNSCIEDAITGKADSSPLNHFQQPSQSEDICRISMISDACIDKGKNPLSSALPVSLVGYEDQVSNAINCFHLFYFLHNGIEHAMLSFGITCFWNNRRLSFYFIYISWVLNIHFNHVSKNYCSDLNALILLPSEAQNEC